MTPEELSILEKNREFIEALFSVIDNDSWLKERGIISMSVIAEATMDPALLIKYDDDREEYVRGFEGMAQKMLELR